MALKLSTPQAASHFGVNIKTIRRWINNGKLSAKMVDGRWHVHIEGHDVPPPAQDKAPHLQEQLKRADREIDHLREQLASRDSQVDNFQQLLGLAQKNIAGLTEQLDTSRQVIEDMRHLPWWRRLLKRQ
jgi:peptidoglycan hydrolase CwlO-like protein